MSDADFDPEEIERAIALSMGKKDLPPPPPPPKTRKEARKEMRLSIIADNLDDELTYSLHTTTVEEQAEREPDFVGNAKYFKLDHKQAREDLWGTYIIVYTRALSDETGETIELPKIGIKHSIDIATIPSMVGGQRKRDTQDILDQGYWGAGFLRYQGQRLLMKLAHAWAAPDKTATTLDFEPPESRTEPKSRFEKFLAAGLVAGSKISFGIRELDEKFIDGRFRSVGFEFVRLVLASPGFDKQLVVGVHVTAAKGRDVSSMFLLAQEIEWPQDRNTAMVAARPKRKDSFQKRKSSENGSGESSTGSSSSKKHKAGNCFRPSCGAPSKRTSSSEYPYQSSEDAMKLSKYEDEMLLDALYENIWGKLADDQIVFGADGDIGYESDRTVKRYRFVKGKKDAEEDLYSAD